MEKSRKNQELTWTVVIVALIVFWPVGILLLLMKLLKNRSIIFVLVPILYVSGVFAIFLALIGSSSYIEEGSFKGPEFVLMVGFIVGGGYLIYKGREISKTKRRYKKYIGVIKVQGRNDIQEIANKMSLTEQEAIDDIRDIIQLGLMSGKITTENEVIIDEPKIEEKLVSITCRNCGAPNQIPEGKTKKCEYCGSVLNVK